MAVGRVRFGDFEVDFTRRELRKRGIRVALQHKPFRVLELLLRHPGELVTREELVRCLWPDSHVSFAHGLNTAVNSLRQVLGDSSRQCQFIETRPGLGYRFNAPVEEVTLVEWKRGNLHAPGTNADAYEDYLKGRYLLDRMTEEDAHKAIAFFKSAALEERCCTLAHAGMADAYCQLAMIGSLAWSKAAGLARSAADVAVRSDATAMQAHVADGRVKMLFDGDFEAALEAVRHALSLDRGSVSANTLYASLLCALRDYAEALQTCREAVALDLLSFPVNLQLAACLYAARDFAGAIDQCWKMLTLAPRFAPAQIVLALAYGQVGMEEEALVELQNAKRCAGFQAAGPSGLLRGLGIDHAEQNSLAVQSVYRV